MGCAGKGGRWFPQEPDSYFDPVGMGIFYVRGMVCFTTGPVPVFLPAIQFDIGRNDIQSRELDVWRYRAGAADIICSPGKEYDRAYMPDRFYGDKGAVNTCVRNKLVYLGTALSMNLSKSFFSCIKDGLWMYIICPAG